MKYEKLIVNDEIRESQLGGSIELSDGKVYYELKGPKNGELIVLVHGFSVPSFVWDHNFQFLVDKGFRVLRYDLYGRGLSDRPKNVKYDENLFNRQLYELVSKLGLTESKFNLIGLSMGGPIVTLFTKRHFALVKRLILIDTVGFSLDTEDVPTFLKIPPLLVKFIFKIIGNKILIKKIDENFYKPKDFPDFEEKFTEQMKFKGYKSAILSTIFNFPLQESESVFKEVGKLDMPKLLLWGEFDPYPISNKVKNALPKVEFHMIKNSGHMPQYEKPNETNEILLKFMQK